MIQNDNARNIDIIVPIYKNALLAQVCVDSICAHLDEIAHRCPRVVLINDSPSDIAVCQLLERYSASGLCVVTNAANIGFVQSANAGLQKCLQEGRNAILINSDTETFGGTLRELLRVADIDPQIGFVSPRSNNASICSLPHFVSQDSTSVADAHAKWSELSRTMPMFHFVPTPVGFYMFVAHSVLADHGFLREEFGVGYEEENDLAMRAAKVGMRAAVANHAFAYHVGSASFDISGVDLASHRHQNLVKISGEHQQFLPLMKRYENSPHFRAERLMSGLLRDQHSKIQIAFDLSNLGPYLPEMGEFVRRLLLELAVVCSGRFALSVIALEDEFIRTKLNDIDGISCMHPSAPGLHAVVIRPVQPLKLEHVRSAERCAPIVFYGIVDTAAEDSGGLEEKEIASELAEHVSKHASGVIHFQPNRYGAFCNRHPLALQLPHYGLPLPWANRPTEFIDRHNPSRIFVSILVNKFEAASAEQIADMFSKAFSSVDAVMIDSSKTKNCDEVIKLLQGSSLVIFPSHQLESDIQAMFALECGRPIVVRVSAMDQLQDLARSRSLVPKVFGFSNVADFESVCAIALEQTEQPLIAKSEHYDNCCAMELSKLILDAVSESDIFSRLHARISASDLLRSESELATDIELLNAARARQMLRSAKPLELKSLLDLDDEDFVAHAYATVLLRQVDDEGMESYMKELKSGRDKVDLLLALAHSREGRERNVKLVGLEDVPSRKTKSTWLYRMLRRVGLH